MEIIYWFARKYSEDFHWFLQNIKWAGVGLLVILFSLGLFIAAEKVVEYFCGYQKARNFSNKCEGWLAVPAMVWAMTFLYPTYPLLMLLLVTFVVVLVCVWVPVFIVLGILAVGNIPFEKRQKWVFREYFGETRDQRTISRKLKVLAVKIQDLTEKRITSEEEEKQKDKELKIAQRSFKLASDAAAFHRFRASKDYKDHLPQRRQIKIIQQRAKILKLVS